MKFAINFLMKFKIIFFNKILIQINKTALYMAVEKSKVGKNVPRILINNRNVYYNQKSLFKTHPPRTASLHLSQFLFPQCVIFGLSMIHFEHTSTISLAL